MSARPACVKNVGEVTEESHSRDEPAEQYHSRRRLGKATGPNGSVWSTAAMS